MVVPVLGLFRVCGRGSGVGVDSDEVRDRACCEEHTLKGRGRR
jgi:hypothetical protein